MNLQSVKKATDITLRGVMIEIDNHNGSPRVITLRDANGGLVQITGTYGIDILAPAPPKMVKKHRLSGKFAGLAEVSEDFDNEWDAKARLRDYEREYAGDDSEVGLTISEVEIPEAA